MLPRHTPESDYDTIRKVVQLAQKARVVLGVMISFSESERIQTKTMGQNKNIE